jgi:hypothetical protein
MLTTNRSPGPVAAAPSRRLRATCTGLPDADKDDLHFRGANGKLPEIQPLTITAAGCGKGTDRDDQQHL